MITRLTATDLNRDDLLSLGETFFKEAKLPGTFRQEIFKMNWQRFFEAGIGAIWAHTEDGIIMGAIGGLLHPDPYGGELVAQEMFWFMAPYARKGRAAMTLYTTFEHWAIERGAQRVCMANVCNQYIGKLRKLYERLGYHPVDISYFKELR